METYPSRWRANAAREISPSDQLRLPYILLINRWNAQNNTARENLVAHRPTGHTFLKTATSIWRGTRYHCIGKITSCTNLDGMLLMTTPLRNTSTTLVSIKLYQLNTWNNIMVTHYPTYLRIWKTRVSNHRKSWVCRKWLLCCSKMTFPNWKDAYQQTHENIQLKC